VVRITQGVFSYLPMLNDQQIEKQIEYCISKGWAINLEFTKDPHPRNIYWELWGLPLFDVTNVQDVMYELNECCLVNFDHYIKMQAFDASKGCESCVFSCLVDRPVHEPKVYLQRTEVEGRFQRYSINYSSATTGYGCD